MAYTNGSLVKSVDWLTICIYLALIVLGWISVCGASYDFGDVNLISFETRAGKQLLWMGCSLGLGFILLMLEDKLFDWFAYLFYIAMMILLLITPFIAEETKGSLSWIKFGSVSLQPAEFAKFATALALAKLMNVYGFTMERLKYSLPAVAMVLLPMVLIILQKETGSALVFLAFFLMLYREGMPGSILFSGICAVVYFVVGIRFGHEMMPDEHTSIGVKNEHGEILFKQLAGTFARRIVCYARPGDKGKKGDQCGIIKFGSRIDMYLPLDAEIKVKMGEKVKACETVIAELK